MADGRAMNPGRREVGRPEVLGDGEERADLECGPRAKRAWGHRTVGWGGCGGDDSVERLPTVSGQQAPLSGGGTSSKLPHTHVCMCTHTHTWVHHTHMRTHPETHAKHRYTHDRRRETHLHTDTQKDTQTQLTPTGHGHAFTLSNPAFKGQCFLPLSLPARASSSPWQGQARCWSH